MRISGGSNGSGGNLNGSIDAVTNANSVNWNHHVDDDDDGNGNSEEGKHSIRRRRKSGAAGSGKHVNDDENKDHEAPSSDDDDDEERGSTFDAGSSMDLPRPAYQRKKKRKEKEDESIYCCPALITFCWQYCCCGCRYCYGASARVLATIRRLLELFPILKVVGTLSLYVLVTGLVYGHLEGLTVVDSVYFAVHDLHKQANFSYHSWSPQHSRHVLYSLTLSHDLKLAFVCLILPFHVCCPIYSAHHRSSQAPP